MNMNLSAIKLRLIGNVDFLWLAICVEWRFKIMQGIGYKPPWNN